MERKVCLGVILSVLLLFRVVSVNPPGFRSICVCAVKPLHHFAVYLLPFLTSQRLCVDPCCKNSTYIDREERICISDILRL